MDYEGRHIWEIGEPVYFLDPNDSRHKIILARGIVSEIRKEALEVESPYHCNRTIPTEFCYPTANALRDAMQKNLKEEYDKLMKPILNKKGKKNGRSK